MNVLWEPTTVIQMQHVQTQLEALIVNVFQDIQEMASFVMVGFLSNIKFVS